MKRILFLTALILAASTAAKPNVAAPQYYDPGAYVHVTTNDDVSDYYFYLVSGGEARKLTIASGHDETVQFMGIDERYNMGAVYAIPAKSVSPVGANVKANADVQKAIAEARLPGMIKLFDHRFYPNKRGDDDDLSHNNFRIARSDNGLTAIQEPNRVVASRGPGYGAVLVWGIMIIVAAVAVGLVLITVLIGGFWYFVRRRKRARAAV